MPTISTPRVLLLAGAALAALPLLGSPARAEGGVSNGVATVEGVERGAPIIDYAGAGPAPNNGLSTVSGNADGGARLNPGPGAAGGFADGRIPVFAGGGHNGQEILYVAPSPAAPPPVLPMPVLTVPVLAVPALTVVVATTEPRPLPGPAVAEMAQARAALAAGHAAAGRSAIEQAETTLLNARAEGEHGWHAPIQRLEQALAALDHGATAEALAVLPG